MTNAPHLDFLHSFIEQLFDDSGFADLSEETRKQYVPLFVAEAERRMGLALMPLLNDSQAEELIRLGDDDATTDEAFREFWRRAVPHFDEVVESTLGAFAEEFKNTLAKA